ncbi:vWA domain-containing protein [Bernardetia sp.]|uniref:vWA domain-containing protein n=1 Tax=Bernardetia sp. TaxID=1937974 RepID=UPI0025BF7E2C|nr:VWA domain-containing protein [Bernardetia sp.]
MNLSLFKRIFFLLSFFIFSSLSAFAQDIMLELRVLDNQGRPYSNKKVEFVEMQTKDKVTATTNSQGILKTKLEGGKYWQYNMGDIKNYYKWQLRAPQRGTSTQRVTTTYDYKTYERESRPAVDRSFLSIEKIDFPTKQTLKPTENEALIRLKINKADRTPLANYPVSITSYKHLKTWTTTTDRTGTAYFLAPNNSDYEIDIDGIESYKYVDIPNRKFYSAGVNFTYEPTKITENRRGDTITQVLPQGQDGTTARVLGKVTAKKSDGTPWKDEPVFLQVIGENTVYEAYTNDKGEAIFLLPKGEKYMIDFRYQFDVDVLDFSRSRGIGYGYKTLVYSPLPRYQYPERFIPTPAELILEEFESYYKKEIAPPPTGKDFAIRANFLNPIDSKSKQALLELTFAANTKENKLASDINIVAIVDISGSMAGEQRIEYLRKGLTKFVNQLPNENTFSLVVFNDNAETIIPAGKIKDNKDRILFAISRLEADGGTNIYNGLEKGFAEVKKNFKKNATNRLVLLTDGYGVTPVDKMVETVQGYKDEGVECSAVGVGEGYNRGLLHHIATVGGGLMETTIGADGLPVVFEKELNSLISPIARKVKVEVLYNKNLFFTQLMGFEVEEKREGKVVLKLPNVYDGLRNLALLKFVVKNPTEEITKEPVVVKTSYKNLIDGKTYTEETKAYLEWSPENQELEIKMAEEDRRLYAIAVLNQSMKVMAEEFAKENPKGAKAELDETIAEVKRLYPNLDDEAIKKLLEQAAEYSEILSRIK